MTLSLRPGPVDPLELPEPDDPNEGGMSGAIEGGVANLDPYFDEAATLSLSLSKAQRV